MANRPAGNRRHYPSFWLSLFIGAIGLWALHSFGWKSLFLIAGIGFLLAAYITAVEAEGDQKKIVHNDRFRVLAILGFIFLLISLWVL